MTTTPSAPPAPKSEDTRLSRLYDYTKFHIGIYLSAAAGISALLGAEKTPWFIGNLVSQTSGTLYTALGFMILAGMCGGVVASSTAEYETFGDFWDKPQGPRSVLIFLPKKAREKLLGCWLPKGSTWAALEHLFFWLSLLLLTYSVAYGFSTAEPPVPAPCTVDV